MRVILGGRKKNSPIFTENESHAAWMTMTGAEEISGIMTLQPVIRVAVPAL